MYLALANKNMNITDEVERDVNLKPMMDGKGFSPQHKHHNRYSDSHL